MTPSDVKAMALLDKRMIFKLYHAMSLAAAMALLGGSSPAKAQPAKAPPTDPSRTEVPPAAAPPADDEVEEPEQALLPDREIPASDTLMVAGDPPPPPGPEPPPEPKEEDHPVGWHPDLEVGDGRGVDGAGPRFSFGAAFTEDLEQGYFGRFETEEYEYSGPGRTGQVLGLLLGLEGWGSASGGGGGVPMTFYGGFRQPLGRPHGTALFSTMGLGFYWALYDDVHDDGGFGILAPLAAADIGLDFDGVRVLTDFRAAYRWQWGATDHYQVLAGMAVSINSDL